MPTPPPHEMAEWYTPEQGIVVGLTRVSLKDPKVQLIS